MFNFWIFLIKYLFNIYLFFNIYFNLNIYFNVSILLLILRFSLAQSACAQFPKANFPKNPLLFWENWRIQTESARIQTRFVLPEPPARRSKFLLLFWEKYFLIFPKNDTFLGKFSSPQSGSVGVRFSLVQCCSIGLSGLFEHISPEFGAHDFNSKPNFPKIRHYFYERQFGKGSDSRMDVGVYKMDVKNGCENGMCYLLSLLPIYFLCISCLTTVMCPVPAYQH